MSAEQSVQSGNMPYRLIYKDVAACRLINRYKASISTIFSLFYYRLYNYSMSAEHSEQSENRALHLELHGRLRVGQDLLDCRRTFRTAIPNPRLSGVCGIEWMQRLDS
jgi:hypothetical protein